MQAWNHGCRFDGIPKRKLQAFVPSGLKSLQSQTLPHPKNRLPLNGLGDFSRPTNEKQARSIKYQPSPSCHLPRISPSSRSTARRSTRRSSNDLAGGGFIAQQRNVALVGGTALAYLAHALESRRIHCWKRRNAILTSSESETPAHNRMPEVVRSSFWMTAGQSNRICRS